MAVGNISKSNLKEAAGYATSHQAINDVFSILLRMMGTMDTSGRAIINFFKQRGVIENILNFDPRVIPKEQVERIKMEIHEKSHSFQKNVIFRASKAAGPIALWIQATI